jgi:hypothetical protein
MKSSRPSELKSPGTIPKSLMLSGRFTAVSGWKVPFPLPQPNGKHPITDAIFEVPINEICLAVAVEIGPCECPQTIVAAGVIVDTFLERPVPISEYNSNLAIRIRTIRHIHFPIAVEISGHKGNSVAAAQSSFLRLSLHNGPKALKRPIAVADQNLQTIARSINYQVQLSVSI